jgi:hypothetical protein
LCFHFGGTRVPVVAKMADAQIGDLQRGVEGKWGVEAE